jgi:hypothetical protein
MKQMTKSSIPASQRERNHPHWSSVAISVVPWVVPTVMSLHLTDSYDSGGFSRGRRKEDSKRTFIDGGGIDGDRSLCLTAFTNAGLVANVPEPASLV